MRAGIAVPDAKRINRVLVQYEVPFRLEPPSIVAVQDHVPITVPLQFESIDEQAQTLIHESLATAERLLEENPRLAVLEIVWLLETVSTVFRGIHLRR